MSFSESLHEYDREGLPVGSRRKRPRRPKMEIGDIFRRYGRAYRLVYGSTLTVPQDRVLRELGACRTGALGGHTNECRTCGHGSQAYNSCGHRLCPKCRGKDRRAWYEARTKEMLPVEYLHAVFTLPDALAILARDNPGLVYGLLFYSIAQAILTTGRKWGPLRAELGLIIVLHTFGQLLNGHPHGHVLIPAGGISLEDGRWVSLPEGGTLPKKMLRELFQKKFLRRLARYYQQGKLVLRGELAYLNDPAEFEKWLESLGRKRWVIDIRPATAHGDPQEPDHGERIVRYMSRYVSGMVMSNHRLISMEDGRVKFFYKDYRDNQRRKVAEVPALEFIDRFLAHILPSRFRHVRQYGFLAPKGREAKLTAIREMLGCAEEDAQAFQQEWDPFSGDSDLEASEGYPCPVCGQGRMVRGEETPRPTVPQILAVPFLIWAAIAQGCAEQQREQSERRQQEKLLRVQREAQQPSNREREEREEAVLCCPTESPSDELRQQLLPLAFW